MIYVTISRIRTTSRQFSSHCRLYREGKISFFHKIPDDFFSLSQEFEVADNPFEDATSLNILMYFPRSKSFLNRIMTFEKIL